MHDVVLQLRSLRPEVPNQCLLVEDNVSRLSGRHFLSLKVCKPDAKDKRPLKACCVCSAKRKRSGKKDYLKATYICLYCPSKSGLHPEKCFEEHHTKFDFSI